MCGISCPQPPCHSSLASELRLTAGQQRSCSCLTLLAMNVVRICMTMQYHWSVESSSLPCLSAQSLMQVCMRQTEARLDDGDHMPMHTDMSVCTSPY